VTSREKRRLGTRCKRVRGLVVGEGDDARRAAFSPYLQTQLCRKGREDGEGRQRSMRLHGGDYVNAIQMSGVLKLKSTYIDSLVAGRLFFFSLSAGGTSAQLETMSGKWERDIYVYICMHV
jgi:hypothetical protein